MDTMYPIHTLRQIYIGMIVNSKNTTTKILNNGHLNQFLKLIRFMNQKMKILIGSKVCGLDQVKLDLRFI